MRSSKSRSRSKQNRNNRSVGNVINRVFDSSGPEGKVRGTPQQIIEKYNQLARDAQLANDRVAAENFQQHAEHYLRLLSEAQREMDARREQQERDNRERQAQRDRERQAREEAGDTMVATDDAFGASDDFASGINPLLMRCPSWTIKCPSQQRRHPPMATQETQKAAQTRAPRPKKTDAVGEGGDQPSPLQRSCRIKMGRMMRPYFLAPAGQCTKPLKRDLFGTSVGLIPAAISRSSISDAMPFKDARNILRRWLKAAATTRSNTLASASKRGRSSAVRCTTALRHFGRWRKGARQIHRDPRIRPPRGEDGQTAIGFAPWLRNNAFSNLFWNINVSDCKRGPLGWG